MELHLEQKDGMEDESMLVRNDSGEGPAVHLMFTPPVGREDYWLFRVGLSEAQAIIGFPKFGTIGIGFAVEDEDWNTNLPYTQPAAEILQHIWVNAGPTVDRRLALKAIEMIQAAAQDTVAVAVVTPRSEES